MYRVYNPGAGPGRGPVLMPEASVGNRRLYAWTPPAADRPWPDLGSTLARPPTALATCNMYFACRAQKHRFLRCFGPLDGHGGDLGDVQKPWFLRGFGLQGGEKNGKKSS